VTMLPKVGVVYATRRDSEWLHCGNSKRTTLVQVQSGTHILILEIDQPDALPDRHTKVDVLLPTNMVVYVAGDDHFWFSLIEELNDV